ncbi:hypothetical protein UN64_10465 [Fictibacillus arsenicus]|uniref:Uncharacterized protein n=1 Tax=Fictibacillus arsenicus TaxID=255247 RepID=A0A1V3G7X4_9BACL|nr:hypothetical protein UN64_10465 [Fictibacillus arsenicus]
MKRFSVSFEQRTKVFLWIVINLSSPSNKIVTIEDLNLSSTSVAIFRMEQQHSTPDFITKEVRM